MLKIIDSDKIIYLIGKKSLYQQSKEAMVASVDSEKEMRTNYDKLINNDKLKYIYFLNRDLELLFSYFSSMFRIIYAAGGLVKNKENEILVIFRNGKWDLPKGKMEKKESVEKAAIREVEEECGIKKLKIVKHITTTFHTYQLEEKHILKRTDWFEMFCSDNSPLIPQTEEGITKAKWISENNLKEVFSNTYETISDVLKHL